MTSLYGPVSDWQNDFDHADPKYNENIHEIWNDLLENKKCPVAHTERYGGTWLPLTHEYVHEVAYDTDHFTSRSVVVGRLKPSQMEIPPPPAPRRHREQTRKPEGTAVPVASRWSDRGR